MTCDFEISFLRGCPFGIPFRYFLECSVKNRASATDVASDVTSNFKCRAVVENNGKTIRFSNLRGSRLWAVLKFSDETEAV